MSIQSSLFAQEDLLVPLHRASGGSGSFPGVFSPVLHTDRPPMGWQPPHRGPAPPPWSVERCWSGWPCWKANSLHRPQLHRSWYIFQRWRGRVWVVKHPERRKKKNQTFMMPSVTIKGKMRARQNFLNGMWMNWYTETAARCDQPADFKTSFIEHSGFYHCLWSLMRPPVWKLRTHCCQAHTDVSAPSCAKERKVHVGILLVGVTGYETCRGGSVFVP